MSYQYQSLFWFGTFFSIFFLLLIAIPVFKRRRDAFTAWNLLLFGAVMSTGMGSIEVFTKGKLGIPDMNWFSPNNQEVRWLIGGSIVFYSVLLIMHLFVKFPSRLLQNRLQKWPEFSSATFIFVLVACLATALSPMALAHLPFFGEVSVQFSYGALTTATTFATVNWLRNRISVVALFLMIGVFCIAAVQAMVIFHGRRILLSVAFGPALAMYWMWWRYWPTKRLMTFLTAAAFAFMGLALAYSTFRHIRGREERTAATMVSKVQNMDLSKIQKYLSDLPGYFGQESILDSMLLMRLVDTEKIEEQPFESLKHVLSYPVPRRLWPDKPRDLGSYIVREVLHLPYNTTWGMGIVGTGYHEGGVVTLVVYAILISLLIRLFDDPLLRQPSNPFLLSALAIAAPHIVNWCRGGVSTMTVNCIEAIIFVFLLGTVCRILFGTARGHWTTPQQAFAMGQYSNAYSTHPQ